MNIGCSTVYVESGFTDLFLTDLFWLPVVMMSLRRSRLKWDDRVTDVFI